MTVSFVISYPPKISNLQRIAKGNAPLLFKAPNLQRIAKGNAPLLSNAPSFLNLHHPFGVNY
jgi:hypothetical protein